MQLGTFRRVRGRKEQKFAAHPKFIKSIFGQIASTLFDFCERVSNVSIVERAKVAREKKSFQELFELLPEGKSTLARLNNK